MIHPGDLQLVAARYSPTREEIPTGRVPGSEGVGFIEEAAPKALDGSILAIGTRVAFLTNGAWQSSIVLPANALVAVPDDIPDDVATQMLVNTITARHVMRVAVRTHGGHPSRIVLTGAASSVGKVITVLARRDGIPLIRLVRSNESAKSLAELLPGDDIIATNATGWQDAVRNAAGDDIPLIIDGVGGPMIAESGRLLNEAGALISFGLLDGGPADLTMFLPKALTLRGATIGTWQGETGEDDRSKDLAVAIEVAHAVPKIFSGASVFALSDLVNAIDAVTARAKTGNILLSF
jgi:NADPH:quinone reductase-like Zn-dependent oxidoreductase